jgi:hypothetical protein
MRTPLGTNVEIVHDYVAGRYAVLEDRVRIGTLIRVSVPTRRGRIRGWKVTDAGSAVDRESIPTGYTRDPARAVQAILDVREAAARQTPEGLTERERAILDFERDHAFVRPTARIATAMIRFNIGEWRYLQVLNDMINAGPDSPYRRYAPDIIERLERQRDRQMLRGPTSARRSMLARLVLLADTEADAAVGS